MSTRTKPAPQRPRKATAKPAKAAEPKPYSNAVTVSYWWKCAAFPAGIPRELAEALDETAQARAFAQIAAGFTSGELVDWVCMDIDGKAPPEDGHECRGWWELKGGAGMRRRAISRTTTRTGTG